MVGAVVLGDIVTAITGAMGTVLPDFATYAAAALVIGSAVVAVRRVVKGLR